MIQSVSPSHPDKAASEDIFTMDFNVGIGSLGFCRDWRRWSS